MTDAEALRLVAFLAAYFNTELAEETAALWAVELVRFPQEVGTQAVQEVCRGLQWMPHNINPVVNQAISIRSRQERRLPEPEGTFVSFDEFLDGADESVRERARRVLPLYFNRKEQV